MVVSWVSPWTWCVAVVKEESESKGCVSAWERWQVSESECYVLAF